MRKSYTTTAEYMTPSKYIFASNEGKSRKSGAHRYERRKVKQSLRNSFEIHED